MKLSQLVAEATARLADLRAKHGPAADAEVFISARWGFSLDELDVQDTELFLGVNEPRKWFFEIKTEKEEE